ncbi:hypothetical protein B0H13DRAFT_2336051 [Mycena leptocephala]|nr:hypothetical protein B0H13DRAFT_2336051 [Mycena leptocephala]
MPRPRMQNNVGMHGHELQAIEIIASPRRIFKNTGGQDRTPPRSATQFRLLYRGALSLPDSHLLLDGLTFAARLDHSPSGHKLLESPLALALESMRGRPSLRWMGLTKLVNIYMDETGGITMDIHPSATLTRIYFENIFCLDSTASHDSGIKVALGDSDGPETTQMIIFARPNATELQLIVARITPVPPPPSMLRLRRPDDPTPRRLPLRLNRSSGVSSLNLFAPPASSPIMEAASASASTPDPLPVGSCRITDMPPRGSKGKERAVTADEDVFEIQDGAVENKGNRKRASDESDAENQMEQANKTIIKQSAIHLMPIPKTHPEYKGAFLVNVFPAMLYLPEFLAPFKQTARIWALATRNMVESPYLFVRQQMSAGTAPISFVSSLLQDEGLTQEEAADVKYTAGSLYGDKAYDLNKPLFANSMRQAAVGWAGACASAYLVERRRGGWEDDISGGGSSKGTGNVHLAPKPYQLSEQGA